MKDRNDDLTPDLFDYASCAVCGEPTPVPLTWTMQGPRFAVHEACNRNVARVVEDGEEEGEV